jgi:LuxR family transcriptional regulator, maltose regulon positive regulatory protein
VNARARARLSRAPSKAARARPWDTPDRIPPVHEQAVQRGRLTASLEAAVERPLTLIAAAAGAGKTLLMADWARQHRASGRVTWLTLTADDSTAQGLWRALAPALGKAAAAGPPPATPEAVADRILASLRAARRPVALVLDDFHEADSAELAAILHAVVATPSALRVVIATRIDPGLALQRLRLADQLSEIRGRDLAFTVPEAAQLFERDGITLAGEQVETLVERTEGWAAGLRLAALMLADEDEPAAAVSEFAGDDRAVVAYLINEVLDRQPAPMRELLLRTAVVDRVCGSLADALTGGVVGQLRLEELVRRNALVVPLDRHGRWFRYHALFADLLRSQLASRGDAAWREQHRRAARWFAAEGLVDDALEHAIGAGDWDTLRVVLIAHWRRLRVTGSGALVDRALEAVPTDVFERLPYLQLIAAARCYDRDDPTAADALLERAVAREGRLSGRRRALFTRDLALIRLQRARALGDVEAGLREAHLATASLEGDLERDLTYRAIAHLEIGRLQMARGDGDAADELREAADLARSAGAKVLRVSALAQRALLNALDGRIAEAELVLGAITDDEPPIAGLARALIAAERGDLALAAAALDRATSAPAGPGRSAGRLRTLYLALVGARVAPRADSEAARRALDTLEDATADWVLPARCAALAQAARIRLRLALRQEIAGGPTASGPELEIAIALAALAAGDAAAAGKRATALVDNVGAQLPTLPLVQALAVAAAASEADGDRVLAARLAERALELAEPDGLRLAIADAAPAIERVLSHLLRYGTAHRSLIGEVLELVESGATDLGCPPSPLREELSARELAVLRYLPTMLTSQEIAGELFVSLNTVKSHLKNIYRKLDADGRRQAVRRARELGLVAPGGLSGPRHPV